VVTVIAWDGRTLAADSARKAVEIACLFDTACGNGVDVLTLRRAR
jgi:hypothetical protein